MRAVVTLTVKGLIGDSDGMGVIYAVTNLANGKYYIGQTMGDPRLRMKEHRAKRESCPRLARAIEKYGKENFVMEILAESSNIETLNKLEIVWIALTNARSKSVGYNIEFGGRNGKRAPETIEKTRRAKLGIKFSEEVKKRLSEAHMGHRRTAESVRKQFETRRANGYRHSEETRRKMSEAQLKLIRTPERIEQMREHCRRIQTLSLKARQNAKNV